MTRVSVFTPTRGREKLPYLVQAMRSLQAQDMTDWEWLVLDNNDHKGVVSLGFAERDLRIKVIYDNDFDRSQVHPMPYLLNKYYPQANGDLIFYLSDDDLVRPALFGMFTEFFDSHPEDDACWVTLGVCNAGSPATDNAPVYYIHADRVKGAGTIDQQVDGGQICHRKSVLDRMTEWFPQAAEISTARHCDGLFMENMARTGVTLVPLGSPFVPYVIHRNTPVSTFTSYRP